MSDDVKALIESIIDDQAELHIYQDEGYVKNSDVLAEKIVAALEASERAPAVDREALARLLHKQEGEPHEDWKDFRPNVEEIIASGILLDAAEVEARGLEKAADIADSIGHVNNNQHSHIAWEAADAIRARAQQVREGN